MLFPSHEALVWNGQEGEESFEILEPIGTGYKISNYQAHCIVLWVLSTKPRTEQMAKY